MEILAYHDFHTIRLSDFYDGPDYREVDNYDFMGEQWVGELYGFNTCLRLAAEPEETKAISLDFTKDDNQITARIMEALQLPIVRSAAEHQLVSILGEPQKRVRLAKDTITLDFVVGEQYPYYISCTLHHLNGLMYLDVVQEDAIVRKTKAKADKKKVLED